MILKLKNGDVKIKLFPDVAPKHVERITLLASEGKYDNVVFHRVIDGFMAQTGDVKFGNSSTKDPNSANSQFFICFEPAPYLDRNYTVFGKVIEGMEYVDQIKKGDGPNGSVSKPDKIISFKSQ